MIAPSNLYETCIFNIFFCCLDSLFCALHTGFQEPHTGLLYCEATGKASLEKKNVGSQERVQGRELCSRRQGTVLPIQSNQFAPWWKFYHCILYHILLFYFRVSGSQKKVIRQPCPYIVTFPSFCFFLFSPHPHSQSFSIDNCIQICLMHFFHVYVSLKR